MRADKKRETGEHNLRRTFDDDIVGVNDLGFFDLLDGDLEGALVDDSAHGSHSWNR